ncbi:hypothetical protein WJX84_004299 [Apatococcus fuscideae]|uniref:Uncharacterized protein n=1 Tax=Apatococcus fuscideae TaxID=2026836 RepID=A0AAW1S503_9CHLO
MQRTGRRRREQLGWKAAIWSPTALLSCLGGGLAAVLLIRVTSLPSESRHQKEGLEGWGVFGLSDTRQEAGAVGASRRGGLQEDAAPGSDYIEARFVGSSGGRSHVGALTDAAGGLRLRSGASADFTSIVEAAELLAADPDAFKVKPSPKLDASSKAKTALGSVENAALGTDGALQAQPLPEVEEDDIEKSAGEQPQAPPAEAVFQPRCLGAPDPWDPRPRFPPPGTPSPPPPPTKEVAAALKEAEDARWYLAHPKVASQDAGGLAAVGHAAASSIVNPQPERTVANQIGILKVRLAKQQAELAEQGAATSRIVSALQPLQTTNQQHEVQDYASGATAMDATEAAAAAARLQEAAQNVAITQQQLALLEVGGDFGQQIGQLVGRERPAYVAADAGDARGVSRRSNRPLVQHDQEQRATDDAQLGSSRR